MIDKVMLERSLKNCHCDGLSSLVIKDAPQMVRIFLARSHHRLDRNLVAPGRTISEFSVALHRHHCDVTLMPLFGDIYNIGLSSAEDAVTVRMSSFLYRSPISGGEGAFTVVDRAMLPMRLKAERLNRPIQMAANYLHTVYVPYGTTAAWMVWEGEEDAGYNPIVYSNADLAKFDFTGLSQPMAEAEIRADMEMLGVSL